MPSQLFIRSIATGAMITVGSWPGAAWGQSSPNTGGNNRSGSSVIVPEAHPPETTPETPAPATPAPAAPAPAAPAPAAPAPAAPAPAAPAPPALATPAPAPAAPANPENWYQEPEGPSTPSWYRKNDGVYLDVFAAYGIWHSDATALSIGFNYLDHDAGDVFAAHIRFLSLGGLSFRTPVLHENGVTSDKRVTTFWLSFLEPGFRAYFLGPAFLKGAVGFGASFYDGFVPVMDAQLGFGFDYRNWGLEFGTRTLLQPNQVVDLNGKTYTNSRYGLLGYVILQTDFF